MIFLSDTLYAKVRQYQGENRLCLKRYKYPNRPTKGYPTTMSMNLNELQNLLHNQKRLQIEMYSRRRHPTCQTAADGSAVTPTEKKPRLKKERPFYVYEERHLQQQRQRQKQQPRRKKTTADVVVTQPAEDVVMTVADVAGITSDIKMEPLYEDQQQQQRQQPSGLHNQRKKKNPPSLTPATTAADTNSRLHPAYLMDTDVDTEVEEGD